MGPQLDLGTLRIGLKIDDGERNKLVGVRNTVDETGRSIRTLTVDLDKLAKNLNNIGNQLTAKVTMPIVALGAACFKLGSDVEETMNKVDVTFGDNAQIIKNWSETALTSMGMAQQSAADMAALFGDMGSGMGLESQTVLDYSMNLTQLAADMASFKNVSIERAKTALAGVYTGETEALKGMGIVMTEVNLQEFAYSQGIKTKIADMNQAEKVQLRYNYVMEATKNAQGDFARTIDGSANQARIFVESLKELGASFKDIILPSVTPVITKLNELIQKFAELDPEIKEQIVTYAMLAAGIGPVVKGMGMMTSAFNSIVGVVSTATSIFGGYAIVLAGVGAAIAAMVGDLYQSAQIQKQDNETTLKTIELKTRLIALNTDSLNRIREEAAEVNKNVVGYTQMAEAMTELDVQYKNLEEQMMKQPELGAELRGELERNRAAYSELTEAFGIHEGKLTELYGSTEAALALQESYNVCIEKSKEAQKYLNTITDSGARAYAEQAVQIKNNNVYTQALIKEYDKLAIKENASNQEKARMNVIMDELKKAYGENAIAINTESGQLDINRQYIAAEILATNNLSNSKLQLVEAFRIGGIERVKAVKAEAEAVIKTLTMEMAAYTTAQRAVAGEQLLGAQNSLAEIEGFLAQIESISVDTGAGISKVSSDTGKAASGASKEAKKDILQDAMDLYEQKKKLGEISLEDEMSKLTNLKRANAKTVEEVMKTNDWALAHMKENIQYRLEAEQITTDEAIKLYEQAAQEFTTNEKDKADITKEMNKLILEDYKDSVGEIKDMTDEELQNTKDMLKGKKYEYKDNAEVLEQIEEDLQSTKEEIYNRDLEKLEAFHAEALRLAKERYQKEKEQLNEELQEALDGKQKELDAIEAAEKEKDRLEREDKFETDIKKLEEQAAADPENIELQNKLAEKQADYEKWLEEQAVKAKKDSIRQQMDAIRDSYKEKQKEADKSYEEEVDNMDSFLEFQKGRLEIKKENEAKTEKEITRMALDQMAQRKRDLDKNFKEQNMMYQSQVPIIAEFGRQYGAKIAEGVKSSEPEIDAYIQRKVQELEDAMASISFGGVGGYEGYGVDVGNQGRSAVASGYSTVDSHDRTVTQNIYATKSTPVEVYRATRKAILGGD